MSDPFIGKFFQNEVLRPQGQSGAPARTAAETPVEQKDVLVKSEPAPTTPDPRSLAAAPAQPASPSSAGHHSAHYLPGSTRSDDTWTLPAGYNFTDGKWLPDEGYHYVPAANNKGEGTWEPIPDYKPSGAAATGEVTLVPIPGYPASKDTGGGWHEYGGDNSWQLVPGAVSGDSVQGFYLPAGYVHDAGARDGQGAWVPDAGFHYVPKQPEKPAPDPGCGCSGEDKSGGEWNVALS